MNFSDEIFTSNHIRFIAHIPYIARIYTHEDGMKITLKKFGGDTVAFGKYDDEKIAWKVLEKKDNELILLSDHCIAKHAYHDKNKAVT